MNVKYFDNLVEIKDGEEKFIVSREEAEQMLGKKLVGQHYVIEYKGKVYNMTQLSKVTNIPHTTLLRHYNEIVDNTEEAIEKLKIKLSTKSKRRNKDSVSITYNGKEYSVPEFTEIIGDAKERIYYCIKRGCNNGEEIIALLEKIDTYNEDKKEQREEISKLIEQTGLKFNTVHRYYLLGVRTSDEIIKRHVENTKRYKVECDGKMYDIKQLYELTGIPSDIIRKKVRNKNSIDINELIDEYRKNCKANKGYKITYNEIEYGSKKFYKLTGVPYDFIMKQVKSGCNCGKEIIERYKNNKVNIKHVRDK